MKHLVEKRHQGTVIGEMAFDSGAPRTAHISAEEDGTVAYRRC